MLAIKWFERAEFNGIIIAGQILLFQMLKFDSRFLFFSIHFFAYSQREFRIE